MMSEHYSNSQDAFRDAERLANGKAGDSATPVTGYLKHESGRWRSPDLHQRIIAAYTRAIEMDPSETLALYRRALEYMYVGELDLAERDLHALEAGGSDYATGSLPIWLSLRRKDKATAQKHLDVVNARNKAKGLPKQKLSDFQF